MNTRTLKITQSTRSSLEVYVFNKDIQLEGKRPAWLGQLYYNLIDHSINSTMICFDMMYYIILYSPGASGRVCVAGLLALAQLAGVGRSRSGTWYTVNVQTKNL